MKMQNYLTLTDFDAKANLKKVGKLKVNKKKKISYNPSF
jgi:hypothetical protein